MSECPGHQQDRADGSRILRCWHREPFAVVELVERTCGHLVEAYVHTDVADDGWLLALADWDFENAWDRYVAAVRAGCAPVDLGPDELPEPEVIAWLADQGIPLAWVPATPAGACAAGDRGAVVAGGTAPSGSGE
jgi:hypothetical protein